MVVVNHTAGGGGGDGSRVGVELPRAAVVKTSMTQTDDFPSLHSADRPNATDAGRRGDVLSVLCFLGSPER